MSAGCRNGGAEGDAGSSCRGAAGRSPLDRLTGFVIGLMRVGINIAVLSVRATGVGRYTLSLVQALVRNGGDIEWVLLGADPHAALLPHGENVRTVAVPGLGGSRRMVWQQLQLPRLARGERVDLLHCPDYNRPLAAPVPLINTIHDLSFCSSRFVPYGRRLYKRAVARVAVRRSARIIAVSEFTRQEVLQRFSIPPHRVTAIHNGADPQPQVLRTRPQRPFLLFVSTLERRKNIVALVRAFSALRSRGVFGHRLVLAGQQGWGWNEIRAAIHASPFRNDIEVRGYVERDELLRLYAAADAFVYPSLYEGFGLPVLEAMAYGTPVVCSRAASLPEVAGNAAELFEPADADALARAIERVVTSAEVQADLRRKGFERVKQFSWDECARRHCEVYRDVLQR